MAGPRLLSITLSPIAAKALDKKAMGLGALLSNWNAIVGDDWGTISVPLKLVRNKFDDAIATLYLAVDSARALELQHQSPLLLSRINGFFGYRAIGSIKLSQRQITKKITVKSSSSHPKTTHNIEDMVALIEDPDLKAALLSWGNAIAET